MSSNNATRHKRGRNSDDEKLVNLHKVTQRWLEALALGADYIYSTSSCWPFQTFFCGPYADHTHTRTPLYLLSSALYVQKPIVNTTLIAAVLPPQRDCSSKRVNSGR